MPKKSRTDAAAVARAVDDGWAMHQMIVGSMRSRLPIDSYRQDRGWPRLIGRTYPFHPAQHVRSPLLEHLPIPAALEEPDGPRVAEVLESSITSAMPRRIGL